MELFINPNQQSWAELSQRPQLNAAELTDKVNGVLDAIAKDGDQALKAFTSKFDGVDLESLEVTATEIETAVAQVSQELKDAIKLAYDNIYAFHKSQELNEPVVENTKGVKCWRQSRAIEKVGLYIPGESAPLFSTILMLGVPATIAGCKEIVLCTPPSKDGSINPAILFTANLIGVTKIFKVGGAQAIGAMAIGTETVPKVYKIFGPGNQYVTKAKELVQQRGVAIDMPAGPSEVLVIADDTCVPSYVAADLLSQAEHGSDSQVILLTDNEQTAKACIDEVERQVALLPRKNIAVKALENSRTIVLKDRQECLDFSNEYAPEHLIIASDKATAFIDGIENAGSVFLGNYSCESAGDYASGTNHTLPTYGYAKNYSGLSLDSFVKKITFQELSPEGMKTIGPAIEIMAAAEQLDAHKNAVALRLRDLEGKY